MLRVDGRFKSFWDATIILLTIVAAVEIPLRIAFQYNITGNMLVFELVVTAMFSLDIIVQFFSPVVIEGQVIRKHGFVAKKYLKGWFIIDLLAAVPFDLIFSGMFGASPRALRILRLLRLTRLLKLTRMYETFNKWQKSHVLNPSILRLFFFLFWILLIAHWIATGWLMLDGISPPEEGTYTSAQIYTHALYWTVTTLTTVGYGDITPSTTGQIIYTMVAMIIGVGIYGYVIGNISSLLANIDVAKAAQMKKMEEVNAFLRYHSLPVSLAEKVRDYYNYIFERGLGRDESEILDDLPGTLKKEVSLFLNKDLIEKVPFFKGAGEDFITRIVMALKPAVYMPGDYVMRRGQFGHHLYFISKGSVEVVSEDGQTVYATLHEGAFFGEMALVSNERRSASIRTVDYCDFYTLDKDSFQKILEEYPQFKSQVDNIIKRRRKR